MSDWTERARRRPFAHQVAGVERLLPLTDPDNGRVLPGAMLLADEMRLGKTKQVIDTMQILYERDEVDKVIVVCPATVRDVWYDPDLGEVAKHRWLGLPTQVVEYHATSREWSEEAEGQKRYLIWIVTNFEYIRSEVKNEKGRWRGPHLDPLLKMCGPRTTLVIDESAAISNYSALQTRACYELRKRCPRVILLNGTPIVETPENIFMQAKMLDWRILGGAGQYITQYRGRYGVMWGYEVEVKRWVRGKLVKIKVPTEVVGWRHAPRAGCCSVPLHIQHPVHEVGPGLEEIQAKMAPYVLRRVRTECLDLPPKLDPVTLTAVLTKDTWRVYKEMRDDLVAWLDTQTVSVSFQAGVRVMRLAQVTSGFLGGLRDEEATCPDCAGSGVAPGPSAPPVAPLGAELSAQECPGCAGAGTLSLAVPPRPIGREKLDVYLTWLKRRMTEERELRMITWFRFRPELVRTAEELAKVSNLKIATLMGGQTREERTAGLRLMHPDVKYPGPADLLAIIGTGGLGTNMAGAHEVVHVSHERSLYKRQQSDDRPIGVAQTTPVSYHEIIAVGPNGQSTIDHVILKALREKQELASWTISAWKSALTREVEQ